MISNDLVSFYTARLDDGRITEFEKFDEKEFPDHQEELQITYQIIEEMQWRGAKKYYFKDEGPAEAIPIIPKALMDSNKVDYGIRLYCIRLHEGLVILLNGGIKTQHKPENCDNVKHHFKIAQKIGRAINKALDEREIDLQKSDCLTDFELEI